MLGLWYCVIVVVASACAWVSFSFLLGYIYEIIVCKAQSCGFKIFLLIVRVTDICIIVHCSCALVEILRWVFLLLSAAIAAVILSLLLGGIVDFQLGLYTDISSFFLGWYWYIVLCLLLHSYHSRWSNFLVHSSSRWIGNLLSVACLSALDLVSDDTVEALFDIWRAYWDLCIGLSFDHRERLARS